MLPGLLTFAVYLPALRNSFVGWDDDLYITGNERIRALDWTLFRWALTDYSTNYWHPLAWISHAVDYALWGLNPVGHHLTNNLLHAANTGLVVFLIMKLLEAANASGLRSGLLPGLQERTVLITAGITGILFGLHPLHVESVAWVSERKDLLCAFFYLLSLLTYVKRSAASGYIPDTKERLFFPADRHYLLSLAFFLFAVSSKPMAVTLPLILLILDWYPLGRLSSISSAATMLLEKTPFLILSLLAAAGAFLAQSMNGYVISLSETSLSSRLLFACWALVGYVKNMAMPIPLLPYHHFPKDLSGLAPPYLASLALVCVITAWCIRDVNRRRVLAAAWVYYLVTLLPVLGLIRVGTVSFADRFTYLPSLGPFFLLGLAGASAYAWSDSLPRWGTMAKGLLVFATVAVVITGIYLTIGQIAVWKDRVSLWSHVIEKGPERIPFAYNNRGAAFLDKGQVDQALSDFTEAISLDPGYADAYNNRGLAFWEKGQLDRAIRDYDASLSLNPLGNPSYANRGMAFREKGEFARAIQDLTTALILQPDDAALYLERGTAYREFGRHEHAIDDFTRAIALDPSNAQFFVHRGMAYKAMGDMERALEDYTKAKALMDLKE